tara:strand:+ start:164 stop:454 length:291 start_codon:yes stop_codon:yes gene_type:complete
MITTNENLYRGKPRGLYDPTNIEVFFTKLGQEIFKVTEDKIHKTQMTDEDWILYCDTANKCVRFGTVWGPKEMSDFKNAELNVIQLFLDKRKTNGK